VLASFVDKQRRLAPENGSLNSPVLETGNKKGDLRNRRPSCGVDGRPGLDTAWRQRFNVGERAINCISSGLAPW
jgi:hypothetical protein